MQGDEQAIRDAIGAWLRASKAGDVEKMLTMLADDVVFLLPGQAPMRGRDTWAQRFRAGLLMFRVESNAEVEEVQVFGDVAYSWVRLSVALHPTSGGPPSRASGYTLSVWRKEPDGRWVIFRDANLLTPEPPAA